MSPFLKSETLEVFLARKKTIFENTSDKLGPSKTKTNPQSIQPDHPGDHVSQKNYPWRLKRAPSNPGHCRAHVGKDFEGLTSAALVERQLVLSLRSGCCILNVCCLLIFNQLVSKKQEPKKQLGKNICMFCLQVSTFFENIGWDAYNVLVHLCQRKNCFAGVGVHLLYFWELGILQERNRRGAPHLQTTPQKKMLQVSAARFSILNKLR